MEEMESGMKVMLHALDRLISWRQIFQRDELHQRYRLKEGDSQLRVNSYLHARE